MTANTGKYIKFYPRDPWRPGTKIIHTKQILAEKPVHGFVKQVFHPPKNRVKRLR